VVNTEFYSWDTSFGLVNPRLRYSHEQVVFCVNLGNFVKCFLQLGWRLTGARSTHTNCSLDASPGHAHLPNGAHEMPPTLGMWRYIIRVYTIKLIPLQNFDKFTYLPLNSYLRLYNEHFELLISFQTKRSVNFREHSVYFSIHF
jgi:hypothetical protein